MKKPTEPTTTGRARRAWAVALVAAAALPCAAASAADAPTLSLYGQAKHGLVVGASSAEVYVKCFSWEKPARPLELRCRLTDPRGVATDQPAQRVQPSGQWARRIELKLDLFGPYVFEAGLYEPGAAEAVQSSRLRLVRVVEPNRLTAEQRAGSSIGVNTHFKAPWEAFAAMGIHWARDYCWGWLGYAEKAPMASNGVEFAPIAAASRAAGVDVLPCMQGAFRTPDGKRFAADTARIRDAHERLSKAFPTIAFWELDNEIDLQFYNTSAGYEEWLAGYIQCIRAAAEGLRRAGHGAKVVLNGDAGIYHDRTRRLLDSPAKDDFAVINFHYYTGTVPPELSQRDFNTGGTDSQGAWTFLDELRGICRLGHDRGKQAWLTEIGWDTAHGPAVGERLQAAYLARMYLLARWCGVDKVFWFFDRDTDGTDKFSTCGLLDRGENARPSAAAMAAVSKFTALAELAGTVDLGPDRWCLLFRAPGGKWIAAAWSVQAEHPLPEPLASAKGVDVFGNPLAARRLGAEVAYFFLDELPAAWAAQRQAEWLSPTILNAFPGGRTAIEARLPAGAELTWKDLPQGVSPGEWKPDGHSAKSALTCSPKVQAGRFALTAVMKGEGWQRSWAVTLNVAEPLRVSSEPYWPGKPAKLTLRATGTEPIEVELTGPAGGGQMAPARLTVAADGATATFTPAADAAGPLAVIARLASGVRQEIWLRPAVVDVPRCDGLRLDGKLDDWPATSRLDVRAFMPSGPEFRPAVRVGWTGEGLWVGAKVPAADLRGGDPKRFWDWSNLEVFVDGSGSAQEGWPKSSRQFWFMPVQDSGQWRALAGQWKRNGAIPATIYDEKRCRTAIGVEADAFTMEMLIPAEALGAAPQSGKAWRAAITIQTTRPNEASATAVWPCPKTDGILKGSSFWGELRFVGPAAKAEPAKPSDPFARWESDMKRFEAADKAHPPPAGAALFVGSSSIRGWNTQKYFPDFVTINRGFGGSQMCDSVHFAERIVLPCRPRVIVLYAGDNDIASGKTPQRVLDDYKAFVKKVHDALPKTPIVFIPIKPSLARWKLVDKMRQANELIRAVTETDDRLIYVDIDKPMLGPDGRPRKELFQKDGLHLSPAGYELWTSLVMPHVKGP